MNSLSFVAATLLFLTTADAQPPARHGHTASPAAGPHAEPQLENETVQVLRIHLDPHEKIPMHDIDRPRVVIWLTDAHLRDTSADGTMRDELRKAGQVEWVPARRHAGENLDDHAIEFIAVIPKAGGANRH